MENADDSPDESLDPTSELFDPLKALYSDKTKVPVKNAPIFDNITKFESVLKGIAPTWIGQGRKKGNRASTAGEFFELFIILMELFVNLRGQQIKTCLQHM
ncbi:hypothetical protein KQX54_011712 [Cotesia glomerata]|uniref:Uncharacterized protein n=1 Tax=Cotesia glomerata TaxID=32391 RepID=A0AAV7J0W9_COTGL|nr:hypothetical protein KQX54_011712 [Cotesia glomerata]